MKTLKYNFKCKIVIIGPLVFQPRKYFSSYLFMWFIQYKIFVINHPDCMLLKFYRLGTNNNNPCARLPKILRTLAFTIDRYASSYCIRSGRDCRTK